MNLKNYIVSGLAALTFSLSPARAAPPQPRAGTEICVSPRELSDICRGYAPCPPAPECPSGFAKPRISRTKCSDYFENDEESSVGICLHTDDAQRLENIGGLMVQEGPDNLCPWGKNYHCYAIDAEKITKYVAEHINVPTYRADPALVKVLGEASRLIKDLQLEQEITERELSWRIAELAKQHTSRTIVQKPEQELSISTGVVAPTKPISGNESAPLVSVAYQQRLGDYLRLGVEGMLLLDNENILVSTSTGQELLPDGNSKRWTDTRRKVQRPLLGGIGGIIGARVPMIDGPTAQLYGEALSTLYALWITESGNAERTTYLTLPDGSILLGPKTISEPQEREFKTLFGANIATGLGVRIPFQQTSQTSQLPALTIGVSGNLLFIPAMDQSTYVGGKVTLGYQY
ncbi:hypothetical protein HY496_03115 [Candidatus Woesearchaeota archaeon]|nr:hypothetical protein [Candidatus Woesearchaeota archaeon]